MRATFSEKSFYPAGWVFGWVWAQPSRAESLPAEPPGPVWRAPERRPSRRGLPEGVKVPRVRWSSSAAHWRERVHLCTGVWECVFVNTRSGVSIGEYCDSK